MSIEIIVRPASAISVLKHQSVKPATASDKGAAFEAAMEDLLRQQWGAAHAPWCLLRLNL